MNCKPKAKAESAIRQNTETSTKEIIYIIMFVKIFYFIFTFRCRDLRVNCKPKAKAKSVIRQNSETTKIITLYSFYSVITIKCSLVSKW